ncbi:MAG: TIM barrel protein [archaeon]
MKIPLKRFGVSFSSMVALDMDSHWCGGFGGAAAAVINGLAAISHEIGLGYVELGMVSPILPPSFYAENASLIRETLSGLSLTVHTDCWQGTSLISPSDAVRSAAVSELSNQIQIAATVGGTIAVVHPNIIDSPAKVVQTHTDRTLAESLRKLASVASDNGLLLGLENMSPKCGYCVTLSEIERILSMGGWRMSASCSIQATAYGAGRMLHPFSKGSAPG